MPESGSEVSDDFEFIETPAASTSVLPPEDYGVRTTSVSPPILTALCGSQMDTGPCVQMLKANNE